VTTESTQQDLFNSHTNEKQSQQDSPLIAAYWNFFIKSDSENHWSEEKVSVL